MTARTPLSTADDILTTAEVAAITRIAPGTLRAWRHYQRGEGPRSFTLGGSVRYRRSDVDAWLAAQYEASAAKPTSYPNP